MTMAFLAAPAPLELIVILGIALLVLGPKKLPEAARSVGRGVREFRESLSAVSLQDDDDDAYDPDEEDDEDDLEDDDEDVDVVEEEERPERSPQV